MNQIEAANRVIDYARSYVVLTRGNQADKYEIRLGLDGARDDLVGALAVLDTTIPNGEDQIADQSELAEERLKLIQGMNTVDGQQLRLIKEQEAKLAGLAEVVTLADKLVFLLRDRTMPPNVDEVLVDLIQALDTKVAR